MIVPCPWCGARNVSEFAYLGELRSRPEVDEVTPQAWRDYLYVRRNSAGWGREQWYHRAGCRRVVVVERHASTNEIRSVTS